MGQRRRKSIHGYEKIAGRDVFLSYPIFSEEFIIHTDVRKTQLGGVTSKKW